MKHRIVWATLAVLGIISLYIPVTSNHVISYGVDSYEAHMPLLGSHIATQRITTIAKTIGIGTILVDILKTHSLTDVTVDIYNEQSGERTHHLTIPQISIIDDAFAFANFAENPIPKNTHIRIDFSAPNATNKNPIGIRFEPHSKSLALAFTERVPLWKSIATIAENRANDWKYTAYAIALSLLIAIPALLGENKWKWHIVIAIVCVLGLTARLAVIPHFGGVSGGDAYNYLSITQSIIHGVNPFENTKRLPGYPLMLAPTLASGLFDEEAVMRTMQAILCVLGAAAVTLLARSLRLSWPIAVTALAILLFQKDYFWTSMRPEPYGLYSLLLIAALWLYFESYQNSSNIKKILFGIVLGYAAMTRQEGFMFAVVLSICSLAFEIYTAYKTKLIQTSTLRLVRMYAPALLLVLPFFVHNSLAYGNPLYTQYLEGDRLQIVDSFLAFQDSLGATWGIIGSMWKPAWEQLERLPLTSPLFIGSCIALIAWYTWLKKTKHVSGYLTICAWIIFIAMVWAAIYVRPLFTTNIPIVSAALLLTSLPIFLWETRWKGIVISLVLISQVGIATWFHPFPKHYQQSYPIIILMLATALHAGIPKNKAFTAASIAITTLPFFIVASMLTQKINAAIDSQNEDTALDSVTYRAARFARTLPGSIGFDQAYLPARLYFDEVAKYFPDEDYPTEEMQTKWLAENPIRILVDTNANHVFEKPDPSWKLIKTFKAAGKDDKILISSIYEIPH